MSQKLFQHLVNENEVRGAAEKIKVETVKLFKEGGHFKGLDREYVPMEADGEPLPRERKEVITTVPKRLAWTKKPIIELLDFESTRDNTNLKAVSDLVVDGAVIAKNVPATTLLSLEKRLREIRQVYNEAPTLDLSHKWALVDKEKDLWEHKPSDQYRTAKKTEAVLLAPATKEHPANVRAETVDKTIGTYKVTHWSGAIHPGLKADYLERIDELIVAVKAARMRANEVPIEPLKFGKEIFDFIHKNDK